MVIPHYYPHEIGRFILPHSHIYHVIFNHDNRYIYIYLTIIMLVSYICCITICYNNYVIWLLASQWDHVGPWGPRTFCISRVFAASKAMRNAAVLPAMLKAGCDTWELIYVANSNLGFCFFFSLSFSLLRFFSHHMNQTNSWACLLISIRIRSDCLLAIESNHLHSKQ